MAEGDCITSEVAKYMPPIHAQISADSDKSSSLLRRPGRRLTIKSRKRRGMDASIWHSFTVLTPQQVQALRANKREQEEQLEEMNQHKDEHDHFLTETVPWY
jgi:hypothetical protein